MEKILRELGTSFQLSPLSGVMWGHIIKINLSGQTSTAWPKALGIQKHSYQAEYSRGAELISQECEDRLFSGMCRF